MRIRLLTLTLVWLLWFASLAAAAEFSGVSIDLRDPKQVARWMPYNDIGSLKSTPEGMAMEMRGADPYILGPTVDIEPKAPLWLILKVRTSHAGLAQFYFASAISGSSELNMVKAEVPADRWTELRIPFTFAEPKMGLRFDPPGTKGVCVLESIRIEPRNTYAPPKWNKPEEITVIESPEIVRTGDLRLEIGQRFGQWRLLLDDHQLGTGHTSQQIGYLLNGRQRWLTVAGKPSVVRSANDELSLTLAAQDDDGATWTLAHTFRPNPRLGSIDVDCRVTVDQPREALYVPVFQWFAGAGSFGKKKTQAVFAGLEYLGADEPSSSEADLRGPQAARLVPDPIKITFPLMAVQHDGRYVGMSWTMDNDISAVFDSPDRTFQSDGHLLGVIFPGATENQRLASSLLPFKPQRLAPGQEIKTTVTLYAGKGQSVVPAVQHYVRGHGLPPQPEAGSAEHFWKLAAAGWLDSKLRVDHKYRHAYWEKADHFQALPMADAAAYMLQLSTLISTEPTHALLIEHAKATLAALKPDSYNHWSVGHRIGPMAMLAMGNVLPNAADADRSAEHFLKGFNADGDTPYVASAADKDLAKTHFARVANGLTATSVKRVLELAIQSGRRDLIDRALRLVRQLDKYDNTVPRGAQTWEMPLHTPDLLASAHLVHCYTLAYELTGEKRYLERAVYWAWTGVPFIYLRNPTDQPVGPYASIAVLGASNWEAPNWIGLPVQWCGLVYADSLYRLARHDKSLDWRALADGLTRSGVQQTFGHDEPDLQGLLPDSFNLRSQTRNGPAINPGTLQVCAVQLFGRPPMWDWHICRPQGFQVFAPGGLAVVSETNVGVKLQVTPWPTGKYFALISGLKKSPTISVGDRRLQGGAVQYDAATGRAVVELTGPRLLEIKP